MVNVTSNHRTNKKFIDSKILTARDPFSRDFCHLIIIEPRKAFYGQSSNPKIWPPGTNFEYLRKVDVGGFSNYALECDWLNFEKLSKLIF